MYRSHAVRGARRQSPASRSFEGIDPLAWQPKPITVEPEHRDSTDPALIEWFAGELDRPEHD